MTDAQALLRLGALCAVVGALGWGWGFLAMQAPSAALHLRGAPGAVDAFAVRAWITALVALVLAPRVEGRSRVFQGVALAGTLLSLGAHAASAWTGWLGVQLRDAREGAAVILGARLLGSAAQFGALISALRRASKEVPGAALGGSRGAGEHH